MQFDLYAQRSSVGNGPLSVAVIKHVLPTAHFEEGDAESHSADLVVDNSFSPHTVDLESDTVRA